MSFKSLILLVVISFSSLESSSFAGIIDDVIDHCDRIRESNNIDLPLPANFESRFHKSVEKARLECELMSIETDQKTCVDWIAKLIENHPKTIFEWNLFHYKLVSFFESYHRYSNLDIDDLKLTPVEKLFLSPAKEGEYCPIAVYDGISTASMARSFANHVYPLGVSLARTTSYDDTEGSPNDYFRHDLFHAGYHLTRHLKDHVDPLVLGKISLRLSLFQAPLRTKEFDFPPQHLQYLTSQRMTQSSFLKAFPSIEVNHRGEICTQDSLFNGYYEIFHEGEDFADDTRARDITDLDTACTLMKRAYETGNPDEARKPKYRSVACVCNAWEVFQIRSAVDAP